MGYWKFQGHQARVPSGCITPCSLLSAALRSNAADYVLRRFIYFYFFFIYFFLFTVRSQKLLDRFTQNFQELCILV